MANRTLVVDATFLSESLGEAVREVIARYAGEALFFVPDVAYAEATEHLAALVIARGAAPEKALAFLRSLTGLVDLVGSEVYCSCALQK